eukprot:359028-Chlamydomonas_euryale.AAC.7
MVLGAKTGGCVPRFVLRRARRDVERPSLFATAKHNEALCPRLVFLCLTPLDPRNKNPPGSPSRVTRPFPPPISLPSPSHTDANSCTLAGGNPLNPDEHGSESAGLMPDGSVYDGSQGMGGTALESIKEVDTPAGARGGGKAAAASSAPGSGKKAAGKKGTK